MKALSTAVDHFLKVRKGKEPKDVPIPPPPDPMSLPEPPAQVDEMDVDDKIEAVQQIAESLGQETRVSTNSEIHLTEMDHFAMEQLADEVESLLNLLEKFLGNNGLVFTFVEEPLVFCLARIDRISQ